MVDCVNAHIPPVAALLDSTSIRSGALDDPLITFVLIKVLFDPKKALKMKMAQIRLPWYLVLNRRSIICNKKTVFKQKKFKINVDKPCSVSV